MSDYRIFILGAGFSVKAGLPLAAGLFNEVRKRILDQYGKENKFERDVEEYIEYRNKCDGVSLNVEDIELEEFMSYLDIEHFLGLKGSDTWSEEGNESQLMTKAFIGKIIHERTPDKDNLPNCYYKFAESLTSNDIVISFNYDVVLERALEHVGKPYRLFQYRYKNVGSMSNTVDSSIDEVVLLKMHGSLDWFSNKSFLSTLDYYNEQGITITPHDPIFGDPSKYEPFCIVDGPRNEDDPLLNLHRLKKLDYFYSAAYPPASPVILSPSHIKLVYANTFLDFWNGLGRAGSLNTGISIIGFSLPEHDEYVRLGIYKMIDNYQNIEWVMSIPGLVKDNVKVVDCRISDNEKSELQGRYSFSDADKTEWHFNGFDDNAVTFLFTKSRK